MISRITCGRLTSHPSAFRRAVNSKCTCVGITTNACKSMVAPRSRRQQSKTSCRASVGSSHRLNVPNVTKTGRLSLSMCGRYAGKNTCDQGTPLLSNSVKAWHSDDAHHLLGRLFPWGLTGVCGGGAMPRRDGAKPRPHTGNKTILLLPLPCRLLPSSAWSRPCAA